MDSKTVKALKGIPDTESKGLWNYNDQELILWTTYMPKN